MKESVIYQEIFHEGEVKAIRNVVLNMLKNNMNMEDIAKVTGLTVEQVQQLNSSLNKEESN